MSLLDFITTNTTAAGTLTEEDFYTAMRAVTRHRPPRCPPHLISPRATPGSCTRCSWCYGPVIVPNDWPR